jgi:CRISPR-associated protein Cas2
MFVLVAYDVSSTRRRNKVAKILSNYGTRVNFSVFECEFKKAEGLKNMKKEIKKTIKSKDDHIRYYVICRECREKITVQGWRIVTEIEPVKFA